MLPGTVSRAVPGPSTVGGVATASAQRCATPIVTHCTILPSILDTRLPRSIRAHRSPCRGPAGATVDATAGAEKTLAVAGVPVRAGCASTEGGTTGRRTADGATAGRVRTVDATSGRRSAEDAPTGWERTVGATTGAAEEPAVTTVEGTESVAKADTADVGDGAVMGETTLGDAVDSTVTFGSRAKIGVGPPPAIANPSGSIDVGVVTDGASGSVRFEEPRHELSASAREIERATTLRRILQS